MEKILMKEHCSLSKADFVCFTVFFTFSFTRTHRRPRRKTIDESDSDTDDGLANADKKMVVKREENITTPVQILPKREESIATPPIKKNKIKKKTR